VVEPSGFLPNGHLMGTARMGDDPGTSVVDRWGMTHDVPNLGIVDGSVFVTAGSANPTSTIAALSLRTAEHLVATRRWRTPPRGGPPARAVGAAVGTTGPEPAAVRPPGPALDHAQRARLAALADDLVPPSESLPAPSAVGVHQRLVDRALDARPDLAAPLVRALEHPAGLDGEALLAELQRHDRPAARALRTLVAATYYMAPEVRAALGYDGQEPSPATARDFPAWMEEGLLDHLLGPG
jgi:hypothetical protein